MTMTQRCETSTGSECVQNENTKQERKFRESPREQSKEQCDGFSGINSVDSLLSSQLNNSEALGAYQQQQVDIRSPGAFNNFHRLTSCFQNGEYGDKLAASKPMFGHFTLTERQIASRNARSEVAVDSQLYFLPDKNVVPLAFSDLSDLALQNKPAENLRFVNAPLSDVKLDSSLWRTSTQIPDDDETNTDDGNQHENICNDSHDSNEVNFRKDLCIQKQSQTLVKFGEIEILTHRFAQLRISEAPLLDMVQIIVDVDTTVGCDSRDKGSFVELPLRFFGTFTQSDQSNASFRQTQSSKPEISSSQSLDDSPESTWDPGMFLRSIQRLFILNDDRFSRWQKHEEFGIISVTPDRKPSGNADSDICLDDWFKYLYRLEFTALKSSASSNESLTKSLHSTQTGKIASISSSFYGSSSCFQSQSNITPSSAINLREILLRSCDEQYRFSKRTLSKPAVFTRTYPPLWIELPYAKVLTKTFFCCSKRSRLLQSLKTNREDFFARIDKRAVDGNRNDKRDLSNLRDATVQRCPMSFIDVSNRKSSLTSAARTQASDCGLSFCRKCKHERKASKDWEMPKMLNDCVSLMSLETLPATHATRKPINGGRLRQHYTGKIYFQNMSNAVEVSPAVMLHTLTHAVNTLVSFEQVVNFLALPEAALLPYSCQSRHANGSSPNALTSGTKSEISATENLHCVSNFEGHLLNRNSTSYITHQSQILKNRGTQTISGKTFVNVIAPLKCEMSLEKVSDCFVRNEFPKFIVLDCDSFRNSSTEHSLNYTVNQRAGDDVIDFVSYSSLKQRKVTISFEDNNFDQISDEDERSETQTNSSAIGKVNKQEPINSTTRNECFCLKLSESDLTTEVGIEHNRNSSDQQVDRQLTMQSNANDSRFFHNEYCPDFYDTRFDETTNAEFCRVNRLDHPMLVANLYAHLPNNLPDKLDDQTQPVLRSVIQELATSALQAFLHPASSVEFFFIRSVSEMYSVLKSMDGGRLRRKIPVISDEVDFKVLLVLSENAGKLLRHNETCFIKTLALILRVTTNDICIMVSD